MSDDSSANDSSSTPTPSSNQNLIIGLVLGAVVLLLLLLVIQMTGGRRGEGDSSSAGLDALRAERDALMARQGGLLGGGTNPQALADRLKTDAAELANLVTQLNAALAQSKGDLESARSAFNLASREAEQLRQQVASAQSAGARVADLERRLNESQTLLNQAEGRISDLQGQLNKAPNANDVTTIRNAYNKAVEERDRLQAQVAPLQEDNASLVERVSTLQAERNRLLYEIQSVRAELDKTRLFVESSALPAPVQKLFADIAELETVTGAKLAEEYAVLEQRHNAKVIDTISFETNSSNLDLDKAEEIRRAIQNAADGSFFLVVGYASKTGDFDSNRDLSSQRATRVASVSNAQKKEGQTVRAVFLGQTDRFSASDVLSNQVCEIWEVRAAGS